MITPPTHNNTPPVIDATATTHGEGSLAPTKTLRLCLSEKTDMSSPAQLKFALKVDVSHDDSDSPAPPPSPREEEEGAGLSMRSLLGVAVAEQAKRLSPPTIPPSATPPLTKSSREHCDAPLASSLPASRAVSRRPSSAFLTGVSTDAVYRPSTPAALYYLSRSAPGSTSVSRGELIGAARHRRPPSAVTAPPSVLPSRTGSPAWSRPSSAFGRTTLPRNHSQPTFGQFSGKFYDVRCSNTGTPRWQKPTASFGKRRPPSATPQPRLVMHRPMSAAPVAARAA